VSGETFKIDSTDLGSTAYITSWEGILNEPPTRGDLIELDFVAGGVWQGGEMAAYTFEVPMVMKSQDVGPAVAQMRAIQAFCDGTTHTMHRVFTSGTASLHDACTGVVTSATPVWDLRMRSKVGLLLTIQALTEWTTTT
jgi:hypothetical protein